MQMSSDWWGHLHVTMKPFEVIITLKLWLSSKLN